MALSKPIAFKGATLTYHKIGTLSVDYVKGSTTVGLLSYLDQEARMADPANNLFGQYIDLTGFPPGNPSPADSREWAYDQIILRDDWKDAVKV